MKRIKASIESSTPIKKDVFLLRFSSRYLARISLPGQFIHIKIDSPRLLLRRPFSIHKIEKDTIFILFRVRGEGTKILSEKEKGDSLDIVGPLGKGFDYSRKKTNNDHLLVGGGMGVAPLLFLAQRLVRNPGFKGRDIRLQVLLGAVTKKGIIGKIEFKKLGCDVMVATEDGSAGFKGFVTDLLNDILTRHSSSIVPRIYACGPNQMLFQLSKLLKIFPQVRIQVSLEQFMGCGIGVCRACAVKTRKGYKRVCKEGPVFDINDIF